MVKCRCKPSAVGGRPRALIVPRLRSSYALGTLGGFDGPVMQWTENESEPEQVAAGFADMVDAELRLLETNNRAFRENGGYYKTLHADGGGSMVFPALNSGERPLDRLPSGKPWRRFR